MVCSLCKQDGHNKRNCPTLKQTTPVKGEETPAQVPVEGTSDTPPVDGAGEIDMGDSAASAEDSAMQEDAPVPDVANGTPKAEIVAEDAECVAEEAAPAVDAPEEEMKEEAGAGDDETMQETVSMAKQSGDESKIDDAGEVVTVLETEKNADPQPVESSLDPPAVESEVMLKEKPQLDLLPEHGETSVELNPGKNDSDSLEPSATQNPTTNDPEPITDDADPVENGHANQETLLLSKERMDGKAVDVVRAELDALNIGEHWRGKICFKITGLEEGTSEEDIGKVLESHCQVSSISFENDKKNSALVRVEGGGDVEEVVDAVKAGLGENPVIKEGGKSFAIESFKPESLLFIGNLKYSIDDEELRKMFEPHGTIERAFVLPNSEGKSKGYGFVEYSLKSQAARARAEMGNINMDGRVLRVEWCECQAVEDMLSTVLFVDKIPRDLNADQLEADMKKLFGAHGKIQGCHVEIGVNNRPRGFAFIDFHESIQAAKAHQALDNSSWMGNTIRVSFANPTKKLEAYKSRHPAGGAGGRSQYADSRASGYQGRQFNQAPQHGRTLHRPYGGGAYNMPAQGRGFVGAGAPVGGRTHGAPVIAGRGGGAVRTAYGTQYPPQAQGGQYGTRYGPAAVYNQAGGYQYSRAGQYSPYSRPGMAPGQAQPAPAIAPTQILPAQAKARDDLRLRGEARLAPAAAVQTLPDVRQDQHSGYRQSYQGAPGRPSYAAQVPAAAGRGAYGRELPTVRTQQTSSSYPQQAYQGASQQVSQAQPYHAQVQQQGYSTQQQQSYPAQQFGQQQHSQQQPQAASQSQYAAQAAYQQQQPRQAAVTQPQQAHQQQQYTQQQPSQYSHQQPQTQGYGQQYAQPQQQAQVATHQPQQQQPQQQQSYAQQQTYGQQYSTQSQVPQQTSQSTQGYSQEPAQQAAAAQQQPQQQQQWTQQQYADYYAAQGQQSATATATQPAAAVSTAQPTDTSYSSYYQQQPAAQASAAPEQAAGGIAAATASQTQSLEAQWAAYYAANPQAAAQHQQTSSQVQGETATAASYDYYNQQQPAYGSQTADPTATAATSYYQQPSSVAAATADVGQKRSAEYGVAQQGAYAGYQQPQQAGYDDYTKRARY